MVQITPVVTAADVATVRLLLREYQVQLGVNLDFQGFEGELAALPGAYAPPHGRLLLATHDGAPVGCAALRDAGAGRAEMKRLYVRAQARGLGVGKRLVERIVAEARGAGYAEIVLDTLPSMAAAQRLYEQLGFRDIPAYHASPIAGTRFLGRSLTAP